MNIQPCKKCKAIPKVMCIEGLFYVRCTGSFRGKPCHKWLPYEFLGVTAQAAVYNWNYANTTKMKKEDYDI